MRGLYDAVAKRRERDTTSKERERYAMEKLFYLSRRDVIRIIYLLLVCLSHIENYM